jgi:hypothetical protein
LASGGLTDRNDQQRIHTSARLIHARLDQSTVDHIPERKARQKWLFSAHTALALSCGAFSCSPLLQLAVASSTVPLSLSLNKYSYSQLPVLLLLLFFFHLINPLSLSLWRSVLLLSFTGTSSFPSLQSSLSILSFICHSCAPPQLSLSLSLYFSLFLSLSLSLFLSLLLDLSLLLPLTSSAPQTHPHSDSLTHPPTQHTTTNTKLPTECH